MWKDHDEDLDDNLDDSSFNCRNCDFQSQTRTHLVEHLKIKHGLHTCSSCNVTCASKIELETHIKEHMKHKKSEEQTDPENQYSCRSCDQIFSNIESQNRHIIEDHQSHKPCREFATNSCGYERDCRYKHIILKKGEHICYKCGLIFTSKSSLLDHIKNNHHEMCLKFLEGNCTFGIRCIYKHTTTSAQNVGTGSTKTLSKPPHINSQQDLPLIPTRENRLVGIESATQQMMKDMNYMVNQMALFMTRMEEMEKLTMTK